MIVRPIDVLVEQPVRVDARFVFEGPRAHVALGLVIGRREICVARRIPPCLHDPPGMNPWRLAGAILTFADARAPEALYWIAEEIARSGIGVTGRDVLDYLAVLEQAAPRPMLAVIAGGAS